jgi:hypothetical protein
MWLYISGGFLSIVAHRDLPEFLLVRARHPSHIEALFPEIGINHLLNADYPYRTIVHRTVVARAMEHYVNNMEYDNFKNSVVDEEYHDACLDVWRTMWAYGNRYRNGGV